tara:strand:+ start:8069 stop:8602 length:534 start_codon:yes stop_codon:yes gene_type:complete
MSDITEFFKGGMDFRGRTLLSMQMMDHAEMEACHDHIQWMFPLHEKSFHSKHDPILTGNDISELRNSEAAKFRMETSLTKFKSFLGIANDFTDEKKDRQRQWCQAGNHNLLRITRVIRSLRLFGLDKEAIDFHAKVTRIGSQNNLPDNTFDYWNDALLNDVTDSMTKRFLAEKRIDL